MATTTSDQQPITDTVEYEAAQRVAMEMAEKPLPPPINTKRQSTVVASTSSVGKGSGSSSSGKSTGYLDKQLKKKRGKFCPVSSGVDGTVMGGKSSHIIPKGDIRRVPKQNFLVLSYATPDGTTIVRSPRGMVMKFSGCFDTQPEAEKHAEAIRNEDPRFNVFVVDLYKWGIVPLPKDEEPFVSRKYADEMLSRIVGGLQTSMEQGKKEMEERKENDRKKAEEAMRTALKDPNYVMPEKSELLIKYEEEARQEREREIAAAAAEDRKPVIAYNEADVMNILMEYCVDRSGSVIDSGTGADMMKYFIEKAIERRAQMIRATDREKEDENPTAMPSHDEVVKKLEEKGIEPIDITQEDNPAPKS